MVNNKAVIANHKQNNADRSRMHCQVCSASTLLLTLAAKDSTNKTGNDKPDSMNECDKPTLGRQLPLHNKIGTL